MAYNPAIFVRIKLRATDVGTFVWPSLAEQSGQFAFSAPHAERQWLG